MNKSKVKKLTKIFSKKHKGRKKQSLKRFSRKNQRGGKYEDIFDTFVTFVTNYTENLKYNPPDHIDFVVNNSILNEDQVSLVQTKTKTEPEIFDILEMDYLPIENRR